jgi:hypothetical protein
MESMKNQHHQLDVSIFFSYDGLNWGTQTQTQNNNKTIR